jgi:hypothetical protein
VTRLHIPTLGTEIVLAKDWSFRLFYEHRNDGLIKAAGLKHYSDGVEGFWQRPREERINIVSRTKWRMADGTLPDTDYQYSRLAHPLTIPAGALLTIDRIYIRKGVEDFNSVSFWLKGKQVPVTLNKRELKKSVRFWAKLDDVNRIDIEGSL